MNSGESTSFAEKVRGMAALEVLGRVSGVTGPVVRARGVNAVVGQQVNLWPGGDGDPIDAEVIGLNGDTVLLMALGPLEGVGPGSQVSVCGDDPRVFVGEGLLGRVIDGLGKPLDGRPLPPLQHRRSLRGGSPSPLRRSRITEPFSTGVRVVDAMLTVGRGQRLGIFAGPGIGKSTLMGMMAKNATADICVVALVGERGREVREFVEDAINEKNRSRTIVVASTGDEAPLARIHAGLMATTIAEYFRGEGNQVLLLFDSLTRYAMALREVGLAGGELPASKGYPPSVFVELSRILERAGNDAKGGITGIYTVLVEGDDMTDPVADSTQALLDGHVVLSRDMANRGVLPAVDVLRSTSRLMNQVVPRDYIEITRQAISVIAAHRQAEDLIRIGAYKKGSDPAVDRAVRFMPLFEGFVGQDMEQSSSIEEASHDLKALLGRLNSGR
ncbi:MAG: FliI/YscN family ATPase [Deltaproteobacteria bacterium]|nr:FliI/YscN family ATPase [Deltaproteobacteria bacterium]